MLNLFEVLQMYNEFADGRNDIKNSLRNSEKQRRENLIMIFIWRHTSTINHWITELYVVCNEVSKLKLKNKYPKYDFILQQLWGYWEDCYYDKINKWLKDIERKENNSIPKFSKDNLYNFMKEYHEWLAKQLSNKGYTELDLVKDKIKELLNKYSIN